jgi:N-acetyl-gamma-glutamyl-phosphate reductase common form
VTKIPVVILGATGYVGGELLRLLSFHPRLRVAHAVSGSQSGTGIDTVFPHLSLPYRGQKFASMEEAESLLDSGSPLAVFGALPHGESASKLSRWCAMDRPSADRPRVVDISADFRLRDPAQYQSIYGKAHAAPELLTHWHCGVPELSPAVRPFFVAHPGCFTTCVTLGAAPIQASGLVDGPFAVSATTGSTGSGREPSATTHHPERHGNLRAYSPLQHRHEAEMRQILGGLGKGNPELLFVPHSGAFARGIYATIHVRLRESTTAEHLLGIYREFYAGYPFVTVGASPPQVKDIVGSNSCRIGVAARGRDAVIFSTLDNLTKGAAGGAIQWMNRLWDWPETEGLILPSLGWN